MEDVANTKKLHAEELMDVDIDHEEIEVKEDEHDSHFDPMHARLSCTSAQKHMAHYEDAYPKTKE